MSQIRIDLHTHSTASDGTCQPAELVQAAAATKLDVVAITDHDTTAGWSEAMAARPPGLALVRGAELSCRYPDGDGGSIGLHLLAYLFDAAEPVLRAERARIRQSRATRVERMVERLQADGHAVTTADVAREATGATVGRPHVARALVARGIVSDMDTGMGPDWVGHGGPYWVGKEEIYVLTAIAAVRAAGGVPVLAHPRRPSGRGQVDEAAIAEMAAAGLAGLEVDHENHTPAEREWLRGLAQELGLVATGSSDFHGTSKSVALGAHVTHPEAYDAIVGQATGCAVLTG